MFLQRAHFFPDPPILSLRLGTNLDGSNVREGDDVYFECDVHARPSTDKIKWTLNVRKLISLWKVHQSQLNVPPY